MLTLYQETTGNNIPGDKTMKSINLSGNKAGKNSSGRNNGFNKKEQRQKDHQIKRLKKVRIWPSIVAFLLSMSLLLLLLIIVYYVFMQIIMDNSFFDTHRSSTRIISHIADEQRLGKTPNEISQSLSNTFIDIEGAYLLDENDNVILGYGQPTYNLDTYNEFEDFSYYEWYMDTSADSEKELAMIFKQGFFFRKDAVISLITNPGSKRNDSYQAIFRVPYWLITNTDVSGGDYLLVKGALTITAKQVLLSLVIFTVIPIIILFPIVFLFINLINSIVNQKRMGKIMYYDLDTGGPNGFYFDLNCKRILSSRSNAKKLYAVVDFYLANHNNLCTFHGAQEGTRYVYSTYRFLQKKMRRNEICAHNAKANFALLLCCHSEAECLERIQSWLNELSMQTNCIENGIYHIGVSFVNPSVSSQGKAIARKNPDIAQIYNNARLAGVTLAGKKENGIVCFNQELLSAQLWEHTVEENMEQALYNGEFKVYLQPKYDPNTEELTGAEALIRWLSPTEGLIPPGRFIPIFEKNGFITKIDDYMVSNVAYLQSQWLAAGKQIVPVSVNISRAHFMQENLAQHLAQLVDVYGVPHNYIEIELTESAFFDDKVTLLKTVKQIKELGFELSMDDFGAGYSSLNSLKDLPLDVLKLDAEFFRGELGDERADIVVSDAIALAKHLNMRIVAEGIEKKEQVDFLASKGCDMIQGFYYSKPVPAEEYFCKMKSQES